MDDIGAFILLSALLVQAEISFPSRHPHVIRTESYISRMHSWFRVCFEILY